MTSFTYFQEDGDMPQWLGDSTQMEESALSEDLDEHDLSYHIRQQDLESGSLSSIRRHSSRASQFASNQPLLKSSNSDADMHTDISASRVSQKLYIASEDLTIVIAGFNTSLLGYIAYLTLCVATAGLAYLLLRWMPRWRIRLVGSSAKLSSCAWVVIEVRCNGGDVSMEKQERLTRIRINGAN